METCNRIYLGRIAFLIIGLVFIAGSVWAMPQLIYKSNEGDVLVYETVTKSTRIMERRGETSEFTTTRTYNFQLRSEKSDTNLSFILTIDKVDFSSSGGRGFRGAEPEDVEGKRLRVKLTPKGEVADLSAIDEIKMPERRGGREGRRPGDRRRDPLRQFQIQMFTLPDKDLKVGDSWTEKTKGEPDENRGGFRFGGMEQTEERETKYSVVAEEKKKGLQCLHIKMTSTYSRIGEGEMRGSEISTEGEGETETEVWFAPKEGVLVKFSENTFYEGTTAFSGQRSMTMPNSNESQYILKLVKYKPAKK